MPTAVQKWGAHCKPKNRHDEIDFGRGRKELFYMSADRGDPEAR